MNLWDRPRNNRRPNHPSYDTRDAEKQDRGKDQFVRSVSPELDNRHTFNLVGYGCIHRLLLRLRRTSPTELKLYIHVPRVVTTCTPDNVTDPVPNRLNGTGQVWRDRPFSTNLTIESRPPSARTSGPTDGDVGLNVNGISRSLTPLKAECRQQFHTADRLHSERRLQMKEVHVAGVARKRKIVAVRK